MLVYPKQVLFDISEHPEYQHYTLVKAEIVDQQLIAQQMGYLQIDHTNRTISISTKQQTLINIGDIVVAKVYKIKEDGVYLQVLKLQDHQSQYQCHQSQYQCHQSTQPSNHHQPITNQQQIHYQPHLLNYIEAIIKPQNILPPNQPFEDIEIDLHFNPNDLVKARVISNNDSHRLLLTTGEPELGVIFARDKQMKLMVPYSYQEMVELNQMNKQKRKVAKPDFQMFIPSNQQS